MGKGRKERRIPFSTELRKRLCRFQRASEAVSIRSHLMFPERQGGKWHQRNALRTYYCLQRKFGGQKTGFHRLRHTFATQYLRHGGDVVRLSMVLGHFEVGTSMRYLHLLTEDLQRAWDSRLLLLLRETQRPGAPAEVPGLSGDLSSGCTQQGTDA